MYQLPVLVPGDLQLIESVESRAHLVETLKIITVSLHMIALRLRQILSQAARHYTK